MIFEKIDKSIIYEIHNHCFFEEATYYNIIKGDQVLCIYGLFPRSSDISELFWITESFHDKVFSKTFFMSLIKHSFSLGYKEIYTWTRCEKLMMVLNHFNKLGIEKTSSPSWDSDETKVWFRKAI